MIGPALLLTHSAMCASLLSACVVVRCQLLLMSYEKRKKSTSRTQPPLCHRAHQPPLTAALCCAVWLWRCQTGVGVLAGVERSLHVAGAAAGVAGPGLALP